MIKNEQMSYHMITLYCMSRVSIKHALDACGYGETCVEEHPSDHVTGVCEKTLLLRG